jgi:hypothetical protein
LGFNRRDFLAISSEKLANDVLKAKLDEDLLLDGVELFGFLASHSLITFRDSELLRDRHYRGYKLADIIFQDIDVRYYNDTFGGTFLDVDAHDVKDVRKLMARKPRYFNDSLARVSFKVFKFTHSNRWEF